MSQSTPAADRYMVAIQNPQICFQNERLKKGQAVTDSRGLPAVSSGSFAVVFRFRLPSEPDLAIRCFTQSITDHKHRYSQISDALNSCDLDTLVEFSYLERGIQVDEEIYPVLEMEWASGVQLDQYIEAKHHSASRLNSLADRWRNVFKRLAKQKIAHGDLSSGNVLVDDQGQFRLVDYDGIYVPSLAGDPPPESGTPNFQHPERLDQGHYGPNSDSFAGLVIYLSLRAVAEKPELWKRHHTGENLIFKQEDFEKPNRTEIWDELRSISDQEVREHTDTLATWCQQRVTNLPSFSSVFYNSDRKNTGPWSHGNLRRLNELYGEE
jgi:serine/threonine protein kinase